MLLAACSSLRVSQQHPWRRHACRWAQLNCVQDWAQGHRPSSLRVDDNSAEIIGSACKAWLAEAQRPLTPKIQAPPSTGHHCLLDAVNLRPRQVFCGNKTNRLRPLCYRLEFQWIGEASLLQDVQLCSAWTHGKPCSCTASGHGKSRTLVAQHIAKLVRLPAHAIDADHLTEEVDLIPNLDMVCSILQPKRRPWLAMEYLERETSLCNFHMFKMSEHFRENHDVLTMLLLCKVLLQSICLQQQKTIFH